MTERPPTSDRALLLPSLIRTASRRPDALALLAPGEEVSWSALMGRIGAAATRLRAAGIGQGDPVLLSAANMPAVPIAYFAILSLGAIAVIVAPDTPDAELRDIIARSRARLLVLDRAPPDAAVSTIGIADLAAAGPSSGWQPLESAADDHADILFTTGTTGRRKGVLHSHRSIAAVAHNLAHAYALEPGRFVALPMPMSHTFTLSCVRMMAVTGVALQIERGLVNPRLLLARMREAGAAGLAIVPAALEFLRRYAGPSLASLAGQLQVVEMAGAPISSATREWAIEALPHTRILHHYGLTEAPRAVVTDYHADRARGNTAGRPVPGIGLTIVGADGHPAPCGTQGELCLEGDIVMAGYWRDDGSIDRSAIGPHGFATGDMAHLDADGRLFVAGRRDDIINVGGKKVAPDEVEELIRLHAAVDDVCCTARADPVLGSVVEAHVVLRHDCDPAEIGRWLEDRIEGWKQPRHWSVVDSVPRTASGKLQRNRLKR